MKRQATVTPFMKPAAVADSLVVARAKKPLYVPPTADEPLDDIQLGLVEVLASIIVDEILADERAREAQDAGRRS